jgi:hypothetical protein
VQQQMTRISESLAQAVTATAAVKQPEKKQKSA